MKNVGIIGGSGYTGVELLRLLLPRDDVRVTFVSSRANAGKRLDSEFSSLRGFCDLVFEDPDVVTDADCDLVFYATPNGTAMRQVPALLERGIKVVDLSADFRLQNIAEWEQWYGMKHECPDWVERAVYGLPEMHRAAIPDAQHAVAGHRHLPEIEQGLRGISNSPINLTFTPHLLPIIRGIHATLYARLKQPVDLQALFETRYADEAFVDVLPAGVHPETRSVRGTNLCRLAVCQPQGRDTAVIMAVEDNLVKGAAGQAVQNMNLMLGLAETAGLLRPALLP